MSMMMMDLTGLPYHERMDSLITIMSTMDLRGLSFAKLRFLQKPDKRESVQSRASGAQPSNPDEPKLGFSRKHKDP